MSETILIIEDEKHICEVFRDKLEDNHYKVLIAENGLEALKIIGREMPDLVILDIKLPDVTGTEILSVIKQYNAELPVIICTAVPLPKLKTYYDRWANEIIIKPIDLNLLIEKVKKCLLKPKRSFEYVDY